jgi:hypothetical protein
MYVLPLYGTTANLVDVLLHQQASVLQAGEIDMTTRTIRVARSLDEARRRVF